MFPTPIFILEVPEMLVASERLHRRFVKAGLDKALKFWHRTILKRHFRAPARAKYKYEPRSPGYKARKLRQYRSRTDLVASGQTRRQVTSSFRLRGGSQQRGITRSISMRLPFRGSRKIVRQIKSEISRITPDEEQKLNQVLADDYTRSVNKHMAQRKRRMRSR